MECSPSAARSGNERGGRIQRAWIERDGAQGRDRTTDTVIFSHVLYQLSYLGMSTRARKQGL